MPLSSSLPKIETIKAACGPKPLPVDAPALCVWKGMRIVGMEITPALAKDWLRRNVRNRQIKEDQVRSFARQMATGDFIPTHQGIAFDDEENLIDGQHTLNAVVLSGVSIERLVTFNVPSKREGRKYRTMDVVDTGRSRSVADQLRIQHGMKDGAMIAAVTASLANLCMSERTRRISVGQTLEIMEAFRAGVDYVLANRSRHVGLRNAGVLAAFAFAHETDPAQVEMYFRQLRDGGIGGGFFIGLLRDLLTSEQAQLISRNANRGLAELALQTLWLEMAAPEDVRQRTKDLAMSLDGANHFRARLGARVERVRALFALPTAGGNGPVAEPPSAVTGTPTQIPPAAPAKTRPSLERIKTAVETQFKIGWFILRNTGADGDITLARQTFVVVARGFGYTVAEVGRELKKTDLFVENLNLPESAWPDRLRKRVELLRNRLSK